ncbi:MAG: peptide-methionine (S)-S-oxide reductase MsrA [Chitinophagaceae bacterium]|nr:peptide-methionine (S)-S-oxide reductase MsrA [Chitinophagaceae bacterium]
MKAFINTLFAMVFLTACGQSQSQNLNIPTGQPKSVASPNEQVAYFAEGCFWHSELVFQSLMGVRDAVSGYAGGKDAHPEYEKVCTGSTGHAETVQVFYDPAKIDYKTLVRAFFASMDPTQVDRQGNDAGTQYRSIAFYTSPEQKQVIEDEIKTLAASGKYHKKIATQVLPYQKFYPAEEYHQEYVSLHPGNAYVQNVSIPDWLEFKKDFKGKYKE